MDITVDNIIWSPRRRRILDGVSLCVRAGQHVGIVGPNGSGKSSLLRCIYRYLKPDTGRVCLGGHDVWQLPAGIVAQSMAVVLQEQSGGEGLSAYEVVMGGRLPHQSILGGDTARDRRAVVDALDLVAMSAYADRQFSALSGGEKRRVMIARALAQDPKVLVLDEISNHLDLSSVLEIMSLLRRLPITILAVYHDLSLAATYCDYLYGLAGGRVVAEGESAQVITTPLIRQIFGVEALVDTLASTGQHRVTVLHNHAQTFDKK
ncbi:MAG: ABC transporter ATP-binding protein [Pseudomonadota bacterium]